MDIGAPHFANISIRKQPPLAPAAVRVGWRGGSPRSEAIGNRETDE